MLTLVKLSNKYRAHLNDMMNEWSLTNEQIVPYSIRRIDFRDFDRYLQGFEEERKGLPEFVPATTLFCLDTEKNAFIGAVNIRHRLNETLLLNGGHIGDGVRPSERRKGYATKMIALALEECRKLNLDRVLMVCNKQNIGSAKSIVKNGVSWKTRLKLTVTLSKDTGFSYRYSKTMSMTGNESYLIKIYKGRNCDADTRARKRRNSKCIRIGIDGI